MNTENTPTLSTGQDRAMEALLLEKARLGTATADEAFLADLEKALDTPAENEKTVITADFAKNRPLIKQGWFWGIGGAAAAAIAFTLAMQQGPTKDLATTPSEPSLAVNDLKPKMRHHFGEDKSAKTSVPIDIGKEKDQAAAATDAAKFDSKHPEDKRREGDTPTILEEAKATSELTSTVAGSTRSVDAKSEQAAPPPYKPANSTTTSLATPPAAPASKTKERSWAGFDTGDGFDDAESGKNKQAGLVANQPWDKGKSFRETMRDSYMENGLKRGIGRADEQATSDRYQWAMENPFLSPIQAPLSTFSVDVDTASYANIRRFLEHGQSVPPQAVRLEEMVNYFRYSYEKPAGEHPFTIGVESSACPWAPEKRLVKIGLKAKEVDLAKRPSANLVFLCDVSGSMNSPDKLPLLVENFKLLTEKLNADDTVSIVVYAGSEGMALAPTSGGNKQDILNALNRLSAGGSTNGGAGIRLAYKVAQERFLKGGINRVVLCTDGDFNVGTTGQQALVDLVKEKAQSGVFLSVCGYGTGNLNDSMMEAITNQGNGVYHYIDSAKEGRKVFQDELFGTLMTVAKDVKIQVEFNPAKVANYRLIGYDNRMLAKEDFANDKVDAGDVGMGHTVTALYEIEPVGVVKPNQVLEGLKYQQPAARPQNEPVTAENASPEMLSVKLRYKQPEGTESVLLEQPHTDTGADLVASSADFRFAAAVAEFGEYLRGKHHNGRSLQDIIRQADNARGEDPHGLRGEFLDLVRKAAGGLR